MVGLGPALQGPAAKHLLAVVNLQNIPSRQLHRKLGFLEYQIVHFKQFGFFNYYRVQDTQSPLYRRWMTLFNSPPELWKTFWSGDKTESGKKITVVTSEKAV